MEYDNSIHLAQQIENLLHHRANGEIEGFEHILDGIKIIMKNDKTFITGLIADSNKKEKKVADQTKSCKEMILKAFDGVSDLEGCQAIQNILSQLEAVYNNVMVEYMNDVVETIMSYHERGTDE